MEAFDNDLNSYLAGCETKVCSVCGYVGEEHEFDPECPECEDIEEEDFELKND